MDSVGDSNDAQTKKGKFQFTRLYLIEMIITLVSHNNEYLKQLVHDENVQL